MKRILILFTAVVLGLAGLVAGIWFLSRALGDKDTLYQGKPCIYWSQQLTNPVMEVARAAELTLTRLIIPQLTNQIFKDTNDSSFKMALVENLNSLPGIRIQFVPADGRRTEAVNNLALLGTHGKAAIPALLEILKRNDEVLSGLAALALVKVEAPPETVIPVFISRLTDHEGHGRPEVVEALGEFGPKSKEAVPLLVKMLDDRSSKEIRRAVPEALKKIDPEAAAQAGVK